MSGLARSGLLVVGGALVVAGAVVCQLRGAGMGLILAGLIIFVTALLERRYRGGSSHGTPPGPGWEPTNETFRDDETGGWIQVWFNPATGERCYLPASLPRS